MSVCLRPYPDYKDSGVEWLGQVPEHWSVNPMFAVLREGKRSNKGLVEQQVLSLSYGRIIKKHADKLHGLVPESFETYQIIEPGNLILRLTDLQNDQRSLRVGLARDRGIITSAYLCLIPCNCLLPAYAYYLLHAADVQKVFYSMGSGLRQSMGFENLKRLPVLLPSPEEQTQIVSFLDTMNREIDRLIRTKRRLIELLQEQKQAIIHQAVTRGLDPDVRFKPSGVEWLGDIPEHWTVQKLGRFAKVQTGITLGKVYNSEALLDLPYLRVANVQDGHLDLTKVTTVSVPLSEANGSKLVDGDVLMTEGGDIDKLGRGCIWHGEIPECLHQNHVFAVRAVRQHLLPEYLVLMMTAPHGRMYFQLTAKKTTNLASTNSTTIKAFPIPLPNVVEQRVVLNFVAAETASIETAINRSRSEIELIREYRTRLIADVVTGKLDVRGVALPEEDEVGSEDDVTNGEEDVSDGPDVGEEAEE